MSSNSKRRKRLNARQRKDVHKIFHDRLTNLPDSLKTKILSCLSTKDAVKTSILSKEWKWSWTSVTNLDFDDNSVTRPYNNDYFTNFVNRVLLLRDRSYLQRFRMKCSEYCEGSLINAWIAAVLLSNVKEIDFSVQSDGVEDPFMLHCDVFLCKTLVVLKLDTRTYVNLPASVSLPGLKTLHISNVIFSDDVSIVSLLSGAPVLEELLLSLCIGEDVRVVNISAPALTSLTMENLPCEFDRPVGDYNYQVVIDTPSLKYLNFSDYAAQGYEVKNLNHLIKADYNISIFRCESCEATSKAAQELTYLYS